jgi:ribulose-5-phosphate 4-epimerase/fuculose-1-phosphate aldolase
MTEKTETALVELVAKACRILGKLDLTHAALGHVSYRLGDSDTMLIKGKGPDEVGLRYTRPEDILVVNFNANKVSGAAGLQAPSESFLHFWLYKKNPEIRSVIHVHPEHAVLLTICEKEILPIYGAYGLGGRMAAEGVPVYPRSITVHDDKLGEEFAEFMGKKKVSLMRGHGVSVVGNGVEDATMRTQTLNELVTMTYKAYAIGQPKPILAEEIADLRKPPDEHRARGSAGGETGMMARWRYYCALTGEE